MTKEVKPNPALVELQIISEAILAVESIRPDTQYGLLVREDLYEVIYKYLLRHYGPTASRLSKRNNQNL